MWLTRPRFATLLATALLGAAGCDSRPPLAVLDNGVDVLSQGVFFGAIAVTKRTQKTVQLRNTTERQLTLQDISLSATTMFTLVGDGCTAGARLGPGQECALTLAFAPVLPGDTHALVALLTSAGDETRTTSLAISGTGILDCTVAEDLTVSRGKGSAKADEENKRQTARGEAEGRALTYDQGYGLTYQASYDAGYQNGYNDPASGYQAGYANGYAIGQQAGLADPGACNRGGSDGSAGGVSDGDAGGYSDGRNAGYGAGYADGRSYYGSYGCPVSLVKPTPGKQHAEKLEGVSNPVLVSACFDQGFAATLKTNAYAAALEQAKLANAAYQNGLRAGSVAGYRDGVPVGRTQGNVDGQATGRATGYADGANQRYDSCYQAGYAQSYSAAYQAGYAEGDHDGYDVGYYDGYLDMCLY